MPKDYREEALEQARGDEDSTKARILKASADLFAEKGYHGTTTREISDTAGVNIALIHYHWGSKEELWNAVNKSLVDIGSEIIVELFRKYPRLETHEDVEGMIGMIIDFMSDYPNVIKVGNVLGTAAGPDTWVKDVGQITFEAFREYMKNNTPLDFDPVELELAVFCCLGAFVIFFDRPGMVKLYFGEDSLDFSTDFRKKISHSLATMIERYGNMG